MQSGDACKLILQQKDLQIKKYGVEKVIMDSIIQEQFSIIKNDSEIRKGYVNLLATEKKKFSDLNDTYRSFKVKDRVKMGIAATIIVGLLYAFTAK